MEKIMILALQSRGFAADVVAALMEVANATGNATVAIEKILGVYEAPEIPTSRPPMVPSHTSDCTLVSYNPFKEVVTYQAEVTEKEVYYFKTEEDAASAVTLEDAKALGVDYWKRDGYPVKKAFVSGIVSQTDTCRLETWLNVKTNR